MRNFIYIIIFFATFIKTSFADDITGKKILCANFINSEPNDFQIKIWETPIDGYDFISKNRVNSYQMSYFPNDKKGFSKTKYKYWLYYNEIVIKYSSDFEFNIDRTTLSRRANNVRGADVVCKEVSLKSMENKFKELSEYRLKNFKDKRKL